MSYSVEEIDGLSDRLRARLRILGIGTTKELLDRSARSAPTPLIDGPDDDEFRRLLCIADLLRVQGVGVMYALLLVEAGVKSAAALATWEVDSLMAALTSAKPAVKGLRRLPNRREAKVWIVFAAGLPPIGA